MKINNNITYFLFIISLNLSLGGQEITNQTDTNNKNISSFVQISLPAEIPIVTGNRLEIFKHSIINAINPDNYFLNAKIIEGTPKGEFYDRVYIYDCKPGDSIMSLEFTLKDETGVILNKEVTRIKPVTKAESPRANFNILLIGDSFTATPFYPEELSRRLIGNEGSPLADNLRNINFIGASKDSSSVLREGYGGKSWDFFLSESSPFFNKKTKQIDFKNYCILNNYSNIDAVVILLGTNSISNNKTVSKFLDKLVLFNPKIRGLVTGKLLATPLGGGGSVGIEYEQTYYGSFKNTFLYNRRMENLIHDFYSLNFKFVDILPSFDIMNNMRFANAPANFRNQTVKVKQGSDNVHPAKSGYLQIADIIYNGIHDFILE